MGWFHLRQRSIVGWASELSWSGLRLGTYLQSEAQSKRFKLVFKLWLVISSCLSLVLCLTAASLSPVLAGVPVCSQFPFHPLPSSIPSDAPCLGPPCLVDVLPRNAMDISQDATPFHRGEGIPSPGLALVQLLAGEHPLWSVELLLRRRHGRADAVDAVEVVAVDRPKKRPCETNVVVPGVAELVRHALGNGALHLVEKSGWPEGIAAGHTVGTQIALDKNSMVIRRSSTQ